ncbi:MAG: hypothetical protein ABI158_06705 [Edaphobacter sp.]
MKGTKTIQIDPELGQDHYGRDTAGRQFFFGKDSPAKLAGWIVFTVLLCLHFCLTYLSNPAYLNMERYLQGQAGAPYQYRVLPMYIFRALIHTRAVEAIVRHVPKPLSDPYQVIQFGIAFFTILGAVLATSATIRRLTGDRVFARWTSLLVVYMTYFNLAPHWGLNYTLPYDVPSLFFFCLGVYLIISRHWRVYYLMFPLAVLNRETACFLTVFFVVWEWIRSGEGHSAVVEPVSKRVMRLLPHVLVQAAIWIGLKIYLAHVFVSNPAAGDLENGSIFAGHLSYNLHEFVKPQQWPVFLSICGFLLPALWIGRKWIRCAGISWGCGIVMGLWFLGMMKVGVTTEIRIFSEWTAFAVPALALIVYHRFLPVPEGNHKDAAVEYGD